MLASFEYERMVHWGECDPANIIFFAAYARWVSEGLDHLMAAVGIPHGQEIEPGLRLGLPTVSTSFEYKAPAHLYDRIRHRIAVTAIGRKSVTFEHRVTRDGNLLMRAEDTRVLGAFSPGGGPFQSRPIPPDYRARLGEPG